MKRNARIVMALAAILLAAAADLAAASSPRKTQFTLRAGLNLFQASGGEGDYVAGANDFPVTPAHQAPVAGIGLTFGGGGSLALGIDVQYGLAARGDLRDPSDGEVLQADTPAAFLALLRLSKSIPLSPSLRLAVFLGGGGEFRMGGDQEFVSSLGNRIVLEAPEKPFSPLAAAGAVLQVRLSQGFGLAAELRGTYLFRDPSVLLVTPSLGLILGF